MNIENKFLEDEVRCGFYIPSELKQLWAAELEILSVIDKICVDNNINYFADFGTLLGAIRHSGFIPWDDDIDISMFRPDYDRFISLCQSSLPEGYELYTYRSPQNKNNYHAAIVNSSSARFDQEFFNKFHGCHYVVAIDIFVYDYIYSEETKEKDRIKRALYVLALEETIAKSNTISGNTQKLLLQLAQNYCCTFDFSNPKKVVLQLKDLANKIYSEVQESDATEAILMVPRGLQNNRNRRVSKDAFKEFTNTKFEYCTIPVPKTFDEILTKIYGNYMTPIKALSDHSYPCFHDQKIALKNITDALYPTYTYNKSKNNSSQNTNNTITWRLVVKNYIAEIDNLIKLIHTNLDNILDILTDLQELLIDLGNYIEYIKYNNHPTISYIEKICDSVYTIFCHINSSENISLDDISFLLQDFNLQYNDLMNSIESDLLRKKEVVFLPFKHSYWERFEPYYNKYRASLEYDIFVVPIPYYYKDFDGTLIDEVYDYSEYSDKLPLYKYDSFSIQEHHPDIIYIQNPYDQFNPVTSIHPAFYSSAISAFTNKLIYVPWFIVDDFTKDDYVSYKNMSYYVTMPAVNLSDEILLESDVLKETYICKLCEWAGSDTYMIWDSKIKIGHLD